MKINKRALARKHPPLFSNMGIKDVDFVDADSNVGYLSDAAVEEGRDWVTFLKL